MPQHNRITILFFPYAKKGRRMAPLFHRQLRLFALEGAALCIAFVAHRCTAAIYTHVCSRTAALCVVFAAAGIAVNLCGLCAPHSILCGVCALLLIRRAAGLAFHAGAGTGYMDCRKCAAACLIMCAGAYLTFKFVHLASSFPESIQSKRRISGFFEKQLCGIIVAFQ